MEDKNENVEIKDFVIMASEYERENFNYSFLDGHKNLEYKKLKVEYNNRRKRLEDDLKKLSFLEFSQVIMLLKIQYHFTIRKLIYFINLRLKFYEPVVVEKKSPDIERIVSNLKFCFDFLLYNQKKNEEYFLNDEKLLQNFTQILNSQIYITKDRKLEIYLIQALFKPFDDYISEEVGASFDQTLEFLLLCDSIIYQKSRWFHNYLNGTKKDEWDKDVISQLQFVYIIREKEINELIEENSNSTNLNSNAIKMLINYFSCEFGCNTSEINSLLEVTSFSKKIFILNQNKEYFIFPVFLNYWYKVKLIFENILRKTDYWEKYNGYQAKFLESFTGDIFEAIFQKRVYKNIWLDDKHEVDGLVQFNDYLIIIECEKRELRPASLRGATKSLKTDVSRTLKKNFKQLKERRHYIEDKKVVNLYDSNKRDKKIIDTIKIDDFSEILCFSITFDDLTFILSQKFFYEFFDLEFSSKNLISVSVRILYSLIKIYDNSLIILSYLILRNEFLLQLSKHSLVMEEYDLMGLYNEGYFNSNLNYNEKHLIVTDHSQNISNFLILDNTDNDEFRKKIKPFYSEYHCFLKLIHYLCSIEERYSTEFALYLLSTEKKNMVSINEYIIESSEKLKTNTLNKFQRFFLGLSHKDLLLIIIITNEIPNDPIEFPKRKLPYQLKNYATYIMFITNPQFTLYKIQKNDFI